MPLLDLLLDTLNALLSIPSHWEKRHRLLLTSALILGTAVICLICLNAIL